MSTILIKNGSYRNQPVSGMVFNLVKGYQTGAKGGYVTVKSDGYFGENVPDVVRVKVDSIDDLELGGAVDQHYRRLGAKLSVDQSFKQLLTQKGDFGEIRNVSFP